MPLGIATALKINIFISSSQLHNPAYYVFPLCEESKGVVFLVHNSESNGHYDAALPYVCTIKKQITINQKKKCESCTCRVNRKDDSIKSCMPNTAYATRCKCYGQGVSCSLNCPVNQTKSQTTVIRALPIKVQQQPKILINANIITNQLCNQDTR